MRAEIISNHWRKQTFKPFRMFLSEGATYDIRHPEIMIASRNEIVIGLPTSVEVPERLAFCDPVHVVRIEPLNGSQRSSRSKRKPRT
ncbi:MAG: hypothetical protein HJJLKODD_01625 [Phycisphaerae bacterium]|nr:hypothetical protein [Phycisphaerae bacterium]